MIYRVGRIVRDVYGRKWRVMAQSPSGFVLMQLHLNTTWQLDTWSWNYHFASRPEAWK